MLRLLGPKRLPDDGGLNNAWSLAFGWEIPLERNDAVSHTVLECRAFAVRNRIAREAARSGYRRCQG